MVRTITEFKIDVNERGEYNSNTMYYPHDLVTSNCRSYLSVVASKGAALDNAYYWLAIAKGEPGTPGKDGLSAYQLAVQEQGFVGSVKDWLNSLKGDQGDPGSPGTMAGFLNTVDYSKYTNLNGLTSGPVFYLSQKLSNQPADVSSAFLLVLNNTDHSVVTQFFINPATNDIYVRSLNSGTWSDWRWITQW